MFMYTVQPGDLIMFMYTVTTKGSDYVYVHCTTRNLIMFMYTVQPGDLIMFMYIVQPGDLIMFI